jgi:hypothetical protein
MTKQAIFVSPLRISPFATVRCKGCENWIVPLENPNPNLILTGNGAVSDDGGFEFSPVFDLYHARCWLTAAKLEEVNNG